MGSARKFDVVGDTERSTEQVEPEEFRTEPNLRRTQVSGEQHRARATETTETRVVVPGTGRVLLVDDHAELRRVWSRALRRVGNHVMEAESGAQAIITIYETHFDLVVSDVQMPDMTGLELLTHIRAIDHELSVVLISGAPETGSIDQARALGVLEYLTKPIDLGKLVTTVSRGIALSQTLRR